MRCWWPSVLRAACVARAARPTSRALSQRPPPPPPSIDSDVTPLVEQEARRFVDLRRLLVRGGRGGNGCVSFHHEPFTRFRNADGADGGRGGRVVIRVDENLSSLDSVGTSMLGTDGSHGRGKGRTGALGPDAVLLVPPGTLVFTPLDPGVEGPTPPPVDLAAPGAECVVAEGGRGGQGNTFNGSPLTDPADPLTKGEAGEERRLVLELKTIADVGLVGLPNAGKSTFLRAVSRAHPKVAPYPFTTLNPHLGVVEFRDFFRLTVADIPGLIAGAHANVGLGHQFLRHIERAPILAYVVDLSEGPAACVAALATLQHELECHLGGLARRPGVVIANKADLPDAAATAHALQATTPLAVIPVSSLHGTGVTAVTAALRRHVEMLRPAPTQAEKADAFQLDLFTTTYGRNRTKSRPAKKPRSTAV